jgi:hypothetical protein
LKTTSSRTRVLECPKIAEQFFGLVKDFSWNVRTDGGYDIDLTLISTGDVIESLKINSSDTKGNINIINRPIAPFELVSL